MSKGKFRSIKVVESYKLTPHLQRIRFTGEDLKDFPRDEEGAYVKVIIGQTKKEIELSGKRPKMRSYTIADFDDKNHVLTLDFMIGHHEGFTSHWAANAKVDDEIVIAGPGPRKIYDFPETDYLLFGDLTSVNAIFAYLKRAPKLATGDAYIAISSDEDKLAIDFDNGINLHWIDINEDQYFLKELKSYQHLTDRTIVFGAGEADEVKFIRQFLKDKFNNVLDHHYLSGYWKQNKTDEEYREEKVKE